MRRIFRFLRKVHLVLAFFRVKKIVVEHNPDGSPGRVIRYRGAERYIREVDG